MFSKAQAQEVEIKYVLIKEELELIKKTNVDDVLKVIKRIGLKRQDYFVVGVYNSLNKALAVLSKYRCTARIKEKYTGKNLYCEKVLDCELYYIEKRFYMIDGRVEETGEYTIAKIYDSDIEKVGTVADEMLSKGVEMPYDVYKYVKKHNKGSEYRDALYEAIDNHKNAEFCSSCEKKFLTSRLKYMTVNGEYRTDIYGKRGCYCCDCFANEKEDVFTEEKNDKVPIEEVPLVNG